MMLAPRAKPGNPDYRDGNRLQLLCTGAEYFPALERDIENATRDVFLETYIYEYDETGRRITTALCAASRRGVAVHVLVDGFGAMELHEEIKARFTDAGVRLQVFRPIVTTLSSLRRERLRRLHRKVAVVDGRVAYVGGINIIDDMHTPGQTPPRYDYAVRVEGTLLPTIYTNAIRLWRRVAWVNRGRRPAAHQPRSDGTARGAQRAAFVVRDNFRHRSDIEDAYLDAIHTARDEIIIANAYFFPGRRFRQALINAAQRGARVTLLLQGKVEYVLLHYASRALYGTLLAAGVEIREYHKSFLHAKVAVIDGHWATVGSSNIDPFSLLLAREANLVVDDKTFAGQLRLSLHKSMEEGSLMVVRERWFNQPLWRRIPIWIGYGLARLLMGVVGYGGKL